MYCIDTSCEGFLTKWREKVDFLIHMLQVFSHCSISSLAVPWLCSLVPALTILSSGELIPAARFRSCSISSLAVPWLGSLVPDLTPPTLTWTSLLGLECAAAGLLCRHYDVQRLVDQRHHRVPGLLCDEQDVQLLPSSLWTEQQQRRVDFLTAV